MESHSHSVLYGPNQEFFESSHLLHRLFEDYLHTHPEIAYRVALNFKNNSITFEQLNHKANKLARFLSDFIHNNNHHEDNNSSNIIGVFLPPSDDLIVVLFAILKLGASYLPLDSTFSDNRISHILADSSPLAVISTREFSARVSKAWNGLILHHEDLKLEKIGSEFSNTNLEPKETIDSNPSVAAVLYTSGSTGVPKGVALSYSAILNRLNWQWTAFPFSENETCVLKTTLSFVDSVSEIFGSLLQGKQLVIVSREDVKNTTAFVDILEKYEIERLMLVPSLLKSIFLFSRMSPLKPLLPKLRLVISSAETVTIEFLQEFFEVFPNGKTLANFYGSTEITDVTYSIFENPQDIRDKTVDSKVPIGTPITNTNIYILDKNRKIAPLGEIGEIYVSGKNVSRYLNQHDDFQNPNTKFIPNQIDFKAGHHILYNTGDFGRIVNDTLFFEGRTDSQIKIRGQRVDLSEIERAIITVPHVVGAVVLCYHAGKHDQTVVAFYKTKDNLNEKELSKILFDKLPSHMIPLVFQVEDFPLLHNGKIDRQMLLHQFKTNAESNLKGTIDSSLSEIDPDQRDAALALFQTINEVLGLTRRDAISIESNFFDIGGNSLNVLHTISLLMEKGYFISIPDFLQATTLHGIVNKLQLQSSSSVKNSNISPVKIKFRTIPITSIPDSTIQSIIANSFVNKGDLEQYACESKEEFLEFVANLWQSFMTSDVSFGVVDENNEVIGVSLNTNLIDEPHFTLKGRMEPIMDLLEFMESPFQAELLESQKKVLHGLLLGSVENLTAVENVQLVQFIEEEIVRTAKANDFDAILTTNTSPLTQDVCGKLLNYEILKSVQANQYRDKNGFSAFASAPDNYCIQVAVKYVK